MTIKNFDPTSLRALRAEIDAALKVVADRNGITMNLKTMRYDHTGTTFSTTLEGQAGGFGDAMQKKAISYAKSFLGVDASQPCEHPRLKGAVLTEYREKARKAPWVYDLNGKAYITSDQNMRLMFPKIAEEAPDLSKGPVEVDNLISREVAPPTGLSH